MPAKNETAASAGAEQETDTGCLRQRIGNHFRQEPSTLPVIQRTFTTYQRANIHQTMQSLLSDTGDTILTGVTCRRDYTSASLAKLTNLATYTEFREGPVEYSDEPLPGGLSVSCVRRGLYLFSFEGEPLAALFEMELHGFERGIQFEVMGARKETAEDFLRLLNREVERGRGLRGGVISLSCNRMGGMDVTFHRLPDVSREEVILPDAILRQVERHTLDFSRHASRLKEAGRHLKRGILLHGPPGTGKTFTSMYVASRLEGYTTFLLTGAGTGMISQVVSMARALQPAVVILEDVDLIGTEREGQDVGANAILFELLNQMDGLAGDCELLFILTTNRPEILEPALASRPGRIDQAIEIPLPDRECRRRLLDIYSTGLTIHTDRMDEYVDRTEGVSASFIREFLRKASVFAALDSDGAITVTDSHLDAALGELLLHGSSLTRSMLGAAPAP